MIQDSILDLGLQEITSYADRMYLCTQMPTTFTEATATYDVGYKSGISVGSPGAKSGGGRKVTVAAITDGIVNSGGGTATHYALVDFSESRMMVAKALTSSKALVDTAPWTSDAFDVDFEEA